MFLHLPIKKATSLSLSIVPILSFLPLSQYLFSSKATQIFLNPPPQIHQFINNFPKNLHFLQSNYIVWPYFLPMAIGAFIFSSFGQKVAPKVPK
jgi:uncharacterized membrane protein YfcA